MVVIDAKEMGARFKQLRGTRSQRDFAKEIGIPFRSYQRYESGERMPPIELIAKIAEIAEVPIDWVATGKFGLTSAKRTKAGQLPARMVIVQYPVHILGMDTVRQLINIIEEGDKFKIEAIKAQIKAFAPTIK
jgi:transcriptional regulator with XRE-family HTH domain